MEPKLLVDPATDEIYGTFPADHSIKTIGRIPECDLCFNLPTVSAHQLTFCHEEDGQVYIWDSHSRNNTYVQRENGDLIDVQENTRKKERTKVFERDIITLGENIKSMRLETRTAYETRIQEEKKSRKERKEKPSDTSIEIKSPYPQTH